MYLCNCMHFPNMFNKHFCCSLLIIINKLITNTCAFKSYSCIIVTKNFALGCCSGNILDACTSENLSQSEYFLFRMKQTAAPWASKRSIATQYPQFQRFKHNLKNSFSSALPHSPEMFSLQWQLINVFLRISGEKYSQQSMHNEWQQFHVSNISEIVKVDCKVGLQLLQIRRKLAGIKADSAQKWFGWSYNVILYFTSWSLKPCKNQYNCLNVNFFFLYNVYCLVENDSNIYRSLRCQILSHCNHRAMQHNASVYQLCQTEASWFSDTATNHLDGCFWFSVMQMQRKIRVFNFTLNSFLTENVARIFLSEFWI